MELLNQAVRALYENKNLEAEALLKACINSGNTDAGIYSNLAVALKRQNKLDESLKIIEKSLSLSRTAANLSNACNILRLCGLFEESIKAGHEALGIKEDASTHANLALAYLSLGHYDKARLHSDCSIQIKPDQVSAWLTRYQVEFKLRGPVAASPFLHRAHSIDPNDSDVRTTYADYLSVSGDPYQSLAILEQQQADGTLQGQKRYSLAKALCIVGKQDEAVPILIDCIKESRHEAGAHSQLQQILSYDDPEWQWLVDDLLSEELYSHCKKSNSSLKGLYKARGDYFHKKKDYSRAADNWKKKLELQRMEMSPEEDVTNFRKRIQSEQEAYVSSLSYYKDEVRAIALEKEFQSRFLFIVGLPRCGSTLLETILSLNPDCCDLGESSALAEALKAPEDAGTITIEQMASLGKSYRRIALQHRQEKSYMYYTDKMLFNFVYIPTIQMIMPESKIIVCKRNPMDQVLSIMREEFASRNAYSSDITCIAEMLVLYYDMLDFVMKEGCAEGIVEYNYDDVVVSPKTELPKIISGIGWPWDDRYLEPEKSERNVVTASINQARKPISAKSVKGWQHYAELLEPAREVFDRHSIVY